MKLKYYYLQKGVNGWINSQEKLILKKGRLIEPKIENYPFKKPPKFTCELYELLDDITDIKGDKMKYTHIIKPEKVELHQGYLVRFNWLQKQIVYATLGKQWFQRKENQSGIITIICTLIIIIAGIVTAWFF